MFNCESLMPSDPAVRVVRRAGWVIVGGVWLLVARPTQSSRPTKSAGTMDRSVPAVPPRRLLALFFLTGFAALTLEVAWIRLFTLVVGTSMFSFSLYVGTTTTTRMTVEPTPAVEDRAPSRLIA